MKERREVVGRSAQHSERATTDRERGREREHGRERGRQTHRDGEKDRG